MRSCGLHLLVICGGVALVCAAGSLQQLVVNPRTLTHSWGYFFLAGALQVLAGLLVLAPILWARLRRQEFARPQWGLTILYLAAGLLLVSALPLQVALYRAGLSAAGHWLSPLASGAALRMFGAFLIAVGVLHAFGSQPRPNENPAER